MRIFILALTLATLAEAQRNQPVTINYQGRWFRFVATEGFYLHWETTVGRCRIRAQVDGKNNAAERPYNAHGFPAIQKNGEIRFYEEFMQAVTACETTEPNLKELRARVEEIAKLLVDLVSLVMDMAREAKP